MTDPDRISFYHQSLGIRAGGLIPAWLAMLISTFLPGHRLVVELSNDEPLADDTAQRRGQHHPRLLLEVRREEVDDAVDRLRRVHGVERRQDEVPGLRSAQRRPDVLRAAPLAVPPPAARSSKLDYRFRHIVRPRRESRDRARSAGLPRRPSRTGTDRAERANLRRGWPR